MTFDNRRSLAAMLPPLTVRACVAALIACLSSVDAPVCEAQPRQAQAQPIRVAVDFNDVDLPVFVRFMSELTGKHFILDEKVTGKITVYSPTKVSIDQAYRMFLAALEVRRLTAIPKGDVIQIVQLAELPPERGVYVYKLKHASAVDTVAMLTNVVAKSAIVAPLAGGRPPLRPAGEFEAPVQVFADKPTNSIILTGTKGDYEKVLSVIRSIDIRRRQVFVEAVIMEVGVDRLRQIGNSVQAIGVGKAGPAQGIAGFNRPPEDIAQIAQTLSGQLSGGAATVLNTINVRALLQFLITMTDTNILSTPQLVAADNQKAKIVVGENRPFPTGQAQGITGGTLVTIERKDVGVTLEMTPQVLENNLIRMDVKQEITAIADNVAQTIGTGTSSVPVGPTTTKRALETVTIAHDQHTIVLGGLIRDNVTVSETKIPFLGDIPLLGWLFKSKSVQTEKLNLLVFLTPHLLDEEDSLEVNAKKAGEVERLQRESRIVGSNAVQRATANLLPPGAEDLATDAK
jgi:general secretion pathway protein D